MDLAHTVARIERSTRRSLRVLVAPLREETHQASGAGSLSFEEWDEGSREDAIYTCSGCGLYGSTFGQEHACHRNADGTYEAGGQFM